MDRRALVGAAAAVGFVLPLAGAGAPAQAALSASPDVAGLVAVSGAWQEPDLLASAGDQVWFSARDTAGRAGIWHARGAGTPRRLWTAARPDVTPTRAAVLGKRLLVVVAGEKQGGSSVLALPHDAKAPDRVALPAGRGVIDDLVVVGNRAYFGQFDGVSKDVLWATDGTAAGTRSLATFAWRPTTGDALGQLTSVGGTLWFAGRDAKHGTEPWTSDGTPDDTRMVKDVTPGPADSAPADFMAARKVWFSTWRSGLQRSDGTASGTTPVARRVPWGRSVMAGKAVFVVSDKSGTTLRDRWRLWRTDGTPAGSGPVGSLGDLKTENREVGLWPDGNQVSILTASATSWALWTSDGNTVTKLRELRGRMPGRDFADHAAVGGRTFFAGTDTESGPELWTTDHTKVGTVRVADLVPGAAGSAPHDFTAAGSSVWFVAGASEPTLYRYTPTSVLPEAPSVQVAGVRAPINLARPTLDLMLGTDQNATARVSGSVRLPGGGTVGMRPVSIPLFTGDLTKVSVTPVRPRAVATAVRRYRKAGGAARKGLAVTATVTVVLTDSFGQSTRSTVTEPLA